MAENGIIKNLSISGKNYDIYAMSAVNDISGREIALEIDKIADLEELDIEEIEYKETIIGDGLKLENNILSVDGGSNALKSYYGIRHSYADPYDSVVMGPNTTAEGQSFGFLNASAVSRSFAFKGLAYQGSFAAGAGISGSENNYTLCKALNGSVAFGEYSIASTGALAIKGCRSNQKTFWASATYGGIAIKGATATEGAIAYGPGSYAYQGINLQIGTNWPSENSTAYRGLSIGNQNQVSAGFVIGHGLKANSVGLVIGQYNKTSASMPFVIGGGSDNDNRKDLLTVDPSGHLTIGDINNDTSHPSGALTILGKDGHGNIDVTANNPTIRFQLAANSSAYGNIGFTQYNNITAGTIHKPLNLARFNDCRSLVLC